MSGSLKRGIGDDPSRPAEFEHAKIRKEKQGQDAVPVQRLLDMEDITRPRNDENVGKSFRTAFGGPLGKFRPVVPQIGKTVENPQPHEPLQLELQPSQAVEHVAATIKKKVQEVQPNLEMNNNMNPVLENDAQNDSSERNEPFQQEKPLEWSHLKKVAEIYVIKAFVLKLRHYIMEHKIDVEDVHQVIKQRMTLTESPQYEYSLQDQQLFIHELVRTLQCLHPEVSGHKQIQPNNLIEMLQCDTLDHYQRMCPFVQYLPDLYLLEYITSDRDGAAAKHVICARKLQLRRLAFVLNGGNAELKLLNSRLLGSSGIDDKIYRIFEYGKNVNEVDAFNIFKIIMWFYDVSEASIELRSGIAYPWSNYEEFRSKFGEPPKKQCDKIRVKEIKIDSYGMSTLLFWFVPATLILKYASDFEIYKNNPSLTSGVDVIKVTATCANGIMENLKPKVIIVEGDADWTENCFDRVLTAHMKPTVSGPTRHIKCRKTARTVERWRELFRIWSAKTANIGRKVTMTDNKKDTVTFTLR